MIESWQKKDEEVRKLGTKTNLWMWYWWLSQNSGPTSGPEN
jgi:hypothetical protein